MASTVKRKASTSASSGVMSLNTTPGLGKSGMSRMWFFNQDDSWGTAPSYLLRDGSPWTAAAPQRRLPFFRGRGGGRLTGRAVAAGRGRVVGARAPTGSASPRATEGVSADNAAAAAGVRGGAAAAPLVVWRW